MKNVLVPLLLGLAFIAGAIGIQIQQRALQSADVRDIRVLVGERDSVRLALSRASTASDSVLLAESIARRTFLLGVREFHVPVRQEAIDTWWTLTGPGTLFSAVGVLFIAAAIAAGRRARAARPDDSPSRKAQ